ncbi:uncharacterized protein KD926_002167 [Aspergillus affinis]|uniref:uncharacterized protein n=1 Tax=Aspergillus affinis TaxID=1070780 RepID=UPI0022FE916D|nr:uncharacterized protein KD926_002167 [Aspergillus affinis]KAI9036199.1 hypothetical protein KD926_002167 [Aspergillus affinis]
MFHSAPIVGLILLFSAFAFVEAGHSLWEFSTDIKRGIPFDLNWSGTTTWPGGAVQYCWEGQATRQEFADHFRHALNLWHIAGLPAERFQFFEISLDDCLRDRRNSIMFYKGPGSFEYATTIGKYVGPVSDDLPGPMVFFNSEGEPLGGRAGSNTIPEKMAHEIGHIFGLFHEHQDPFFWSDDPLLKLYCMNIEGYDQMVAGLTSEQIWGEQGICVNQLAALDHGWNTVAHFLPIVGLTHLVHPNVHPENSDLDWNSIMLYHSFAAAKQPVDGNKLTLRKARGGRYWKIPIKRAPSLGDVQALIRLYDASERRALPRLYHDPRSEYHTAFQNLQDFQVCDWPRQAGPSGQ